MTREEAILLSAYTGFLFVPDFSEVHEFCEDTLGRPIWTHEFADDCVQKEIQEKLRPKIIELVQNIAALDPTSQKRGEEMWRGKWLIVSNGSGVCSECHKLDKIDPLAKFCRYCGVPMTDEAVEIVMERLEALKDEAD